MKTDLDLVYCPFREVTIEKVSSDLLEKLGNFSILVLCAIAKNKSVDDIANSVCLNPIVVENFIKELSENELICFSGNSPRVTQLGRKYIAINDMISIFRDNSQERYAVNCFTCQLERVGDLNCFGNTYDQLRNKDIPQLKNKLHGSELLLKTPNYENVKEYMKRYIDFDSDDQLESYNDYIRFQLQPCGKVFYVPYAIPKEAYISDKSGKKLQNSFWAELPVDTVKREYISENYYEVSSEIISIYSKNKQLLSSEGQSAALDCLQINKWNEECKLFYADCYGGNEFKGALVKTDEKCIMKLSARKGIPRGASRAQPGVLYRFIVQSRSYIPVEINFANLLQEGLEDI